MKSKFLPILAAVLGSSAVALGAFGAHGLKPLLSPAQLSTYQTAVDYHFYHALAVLAVVLWARHHDSRQIRWTVGFFTAGILLFSGSLYLLSCRDALELGEGWWWLGPLTPVGGVCFILGWVSCCFLTLGKKYSNP